LRIYDQEFGRYLYPEFDVVEVPLHNALGVEYPGIVIIGASLYQTPDQPAFEVTVAHEAAHQWWYNAVGNNVLDEPWLDEALATYSSSLYYESARGKPWVDGLVENWQTRYDNLRQEGKDDLVTQSVAHFESLNNPSIYGGIVYSKGALFFKALREKIGDQAFFNALRNYYQAYQFRVATGKDLLGIFEQAAGKSLEDFYQQWLYSKNRQ